MANPTDAEIDRLMAALDARAAAEAQAYWAMIIARLRERNPLWARQSDIIDRYGFEDIVKGAYTNGFLAGVRMMLEHKP